MNTVTINGKTFTSNGGSISIINNKIYIDNKDVTPDSKEINIQVTGNVDKLEVDSCLKVSVTGDVHNVKTVSGIVDVGGKVTGDINTISGSVRCGNVGGNISTISGSVK